MVYRASAFLLAMVLIPALFAVASGEKEAEGGMEGPEQVTLRIWDQFSATVDKETMELLHEGFKERYPNVKLERTAMADASQLRDSLRPALQSGRGPDVFYSEVGIGFAGPLLREGFLYDLTEAWENRGWNDKLYAIAKDIPTAAGVTYAVGHELEFVPIYYNQQIFEEVGVEEPSTLDELENIAQKLKDAGYTPFAWGGRDWWQQSNLTTSALWAFLGRERALEGMYEQGTWDYPETREAIETVFVEWFEKGFFPKGAQALSADEAVMLFYQGKAAMHPSGNWNIGGYRENIGDKFEIGSFVWPDAGTGAEPTTVSFSGSGYFVNANSENPEAAIDYIDYMIASEEAARIWYEVNATIPPLKVDVSQYDVHPLVIETLGALQGEDVTVTPGLSMAAPPEVMTFLQNSAVQVITGQLTPDEWVSEFETLWEEARAEGNTVGTFTLD